MLVGWCIIQSANPHPFIGELRTFSYLKGLLVSVGLLFAFMFS